jgi:hypothetical protein
MDERVSQAARGLFVCVAIVAAISCFPSTARAYGSIKLAWDANKESNIAGYIVYYRSQDNFSHGTLNVAAAQTMVSVDNLRSAQTYYFSVAAFDTNGLSSYPSEEITGVVPGSPDPLPNTPQLIDGGVNTYFAEGASGDLFNYRLAILNTTAQNTQFVVQYLREGASPVVRVYSLPAFFRTTVTVADVPELKNTSFGAIVNAVPGVIAERTMSWYNGGDMADATTAKSLAAPSTSWYLAEGNSGFFETFVLLVNPSADQTAHASIDFLTAFGKVVHVDRTILPTQRVTVYTNNDVPELQNQDFGTSVNSDVPILVERAMYFRNSEPMFVGGAASGAVPKGARHWFLAEGQASGFFSTFVLVSNPNDRPVDLDVRYLTPGGLAREDHITLQATQRLTLHLNEMPELANSDVSTDISASDEVIAERTMYWPNNPGPWYGSHNSAGTTELWTRWGLAEGEIGGPDHAMSYVLLANPGGLPTDVTLTYYRENGMPPVATTRHLDPGTRLTTDSTDVGLMDGERFGIVVNSTQPIAVERSVYWNSGGLFWSSGSNEQGTKLP